MKKAAGGWAANFECPAMIAARFRPLAMIVSLCMPLPGISNEKPVVKPRKNAPVFKKLYKGINIDTAHHDSGVWPKIQHDAAHFEAAVDAVLIRFGCFYRFTQITNLPNNRLKMLSRIN